MVSESFACFRTLLLVFGMAGALVLAVPVGRPLHGATAPTDTWVATWATSPLLVQPADLPPAPGFADTTLRQTVRVSLGGRRIRVRVSNAFGLTPLTLRAVHVARATGVGTINPSSDRVVTFGGRPSVVIPAGAPMVSDPLDFGLRPLSDLALTIRLQGAPAEITGHPGSRTSSFFAQGDALTAATLPSPTRVERWYFIAGVDVPKTAGVAGTVAVVGDSITDGRGSTTDGNDRWTDHLARRLQARRATNGVGVVNLGIGGNHLRSEGLGPNVMARLDRDVLVQPGVRWLVVLAGVNDIGTRTRDVELGRTPATADELMHAFAQIVERAHQQGIRVYGATIMPFEGFTYLNYFTPGGEADRQRVNAWIRTPGHLDGVIDFDAVTRDPAQPSRLIAAVDGGDHIHPSAGGYRIMGEAVDLSLFDPAPRRPR